MPRMAGASAGQVGSVARLCIRVCRTQRSLSGWFGWKVQKCVNLSRDDRHYPSRVSDGLVRAILAVLRLCLLCWLLQWFGCGQMGRFPLLTAREHGPPDNSNQYDQRQQSFQQNQSHERQTPATGNNSADCRNAGRLYIARAAANPFANAHYSRADGDGAARCPGHADASQEPLGACRVE